MRFLFLFVAAVITIFASIAAMQLSTPEKVADGSVKPAEVSQSVSTVDVLVAKTPIPVGTVITAAMIDKQPWPEHLVLAGFIVDKGDNANIIGKMSRSAFQAREPLISTSLANTKDTGFLAAGLPAGMRAITIATDAVAGVAGFVFPGDRVDLVFTHNLPEDIRAVAKGTEKSGSIGKPGYAEVLAANVPILAINLRDNSAKEDAAGNPSSPAASSIVAVAPSSMTLQVTDVQAEKIRLAEKVGALSIALRSISDRENKEITPPADLLSLTQLDTKDHTPATSQPDSVKIIRGGDSASQQPHQEGP